MKRLFLLLLLTLSALAQTIITQLGQVWDPAGNGMALSKGPTTVLITCSDSDEPVSSSIGISVAQARQFQAYLSKGYNGRYLGKGKSADYGTIRAGNSEITVLVNDNRASICVTEGRLNRFLSLDGATYNKVQALFSKATGAKTARVSTPAPVIEPKQPGLEGPAYPTHP